MYLILVLSPTLPGVRLERNPKNERKREEGLTPHRTDI